MRIALVTRRYPPLVGGAEKVLSYLASALAEQGADIVVLTSQIAAPARDVAQPDEASRKADAEKGPRIVRLPTARARFVGTWVYMRQLARWFAQNPVDLAYVSMLKHDAYVAVGAGKRLGFPIVLRPEGAGATGDLAWQSWGRFGQTIGKRCKQADAVVAISPAIEAELLGAGYAPARIHRLPNGVPVPDDPWQPRPGWLEAPRALFVGRLAAEKGLDMLLEAWPRVRAAHPQATLTLVGDGPERPRLEKQCQALGLADAVQFAGAVSEPVHLLRASDLFILPSREEGMSIALLEAMALGVPIVATAIPGNLGLATDRVQGRLTAANDPEALAEAILDQWAHFAQAQAWGLAARRRVEDEFSIAAVARRHLELFRQLASREPHA